MFVNNVRRRTSAKLCVSKFLHSVALLRHNFIQIVEAGASRP